MGLGLYFVEGEGPKFERTVRSAEDVAKLAVPDMETELRYVMDAVRTIRRELNGSVPLIGFSGSPLTLACYMVEGGSSDSWTLVKTMLYNRPRPELLHHVLDVTARAVSDLPERPDRIGCAGGADLRFLGRRALGRGLPRVFARLHAAHPRRPDAGT